MSTEHCFKKVAKPEARKSDDKPRTVVGLVKKYGDSWALMASLDSFGMAQFRSTTADRTFDELEYFSMRYMERGEKCRCGE